jgi:hypothetical protein
MSAVSSPKWVVYAFAAALIVGVLIARAILFPQVDGGSIYLFLLPRNREEHLEAEALAVEVPEARLAFGWAVPCQTGCSIV